MPQPRPKPNRLKAARPEDKARTFFLDGLSAGIKTGNFPFYFGQVMVATDPDNAGRIKVRIPLIDDVIYQAENGTKGDDSAKDNNLPWCIPANTRFINTPEVNSIVLVGLFNSDKKYNGRVWFTAIEELSSTDIFDPARLTRENGTWEDAENNIETSYDATPGLRNRAAWADRSSVVNYKVGLRGKNKNKLLFDQSMTTLVQNEDEREEAKLELAKNSLLTAQYINILSNLSDNKYSAVFAEPLFSHIEKIHSLIENILTILMSSPGMLGQIPVTANPSFASQSQIKLQQLKSDFRTKLNPENKGKSKYIKIN